MWYPRFYLIKLAGCRPVTLSIKGTLANALFDKFYKIFPNNFIEHL